MLQVVLAYGAESNRKLNIPGEVRLHFVPARSAILISKAVCVITAMSTEACLMLFYNEPCCSKSAQAGL